MTEDTVRKPVPGEQIYRVLLKRLRKKQAEKAAKSNQDQQPA